MSTPPDTRRLIADRLRARRARVARIRKRTLASAAGTFVLAWGVVFVQLVSGHDPALAKHSATHAAASSSGSATPVTTSASGSGSTSSGSTSAGSATATAASSGSTGSAGTGALTTSQS